MAKHAHRLLLNQKKTWRCTLPGCNYFIHIGLAHILPGKQSICWECGDEFTLDEEALRDDQPTCTSCRGGGSKEGIAYAMKYTEAKIALAKAGVKSVKDLDPGRRRMIETTMGVDFSVLDDLEKELEKEQGKDEVEVIEE